MVDLERHTPDRKLSLSLLPPDAAPIVPDPLPSTLLPELGIMNMQFPRIRHAGACPTVDASALPEKQQEQFHRNLRAVEQVLAGASQTREAKEWGLSCNGRKNQNKTIRDT